MDRRREVRLARADQEVIVVAHQDIGIDPKAKRSEHRPSRSRKP